MSSDRFRVTISYVKGPPGEPPKASKMTPKAPHSDPQSHSGDPKHPTMTSHRGGGGGWPHRGAWPPRGPAPNPRDDVTMWACPHVAPPPPVSVSDPSEDNSRYRVLSFPVGVTTALHGFAGYFETTLYADVTLSRAGLPASRPMAGGERGRAGQWEGGVGRKGRGFRFRLYVCVDGGVCKGGKGCATM